MQFKTVAASFFAAAGLSAAAPLESRQAVTSGDYVWKISEFSNRKPEGEKITSISFTVTSTKGYFEPFTCSASADSVDAATFYPCAKEGVSFTFQNDRSGLIVQQILSEGYVGQSVGSSTNSLIIA